MSDDLISDLKRTELFFGFDENQLSEVVTHLQPRPVSLKDHSYLYKRGDIADSCWEILTGDFVVERPSLRKAIRRIDYRIGTITGLQGLVEPGSRRPVSLIADGDAELLEIPEAGVSGLDSNTKIALWNNVSRILLKKLFKCRAVLNSWDA